MAHIKFASPARSLRIELLALTFLSVFLFIFSFIVTTVSVHAAYSNLDNRLPDDKYRLKLPNGANAQTDGLDCYISSNTHGDCHTGDYGSGSSHQYITLSEGNINDNTNDLGYPGADRTYLSITTRESELSDKDISFDIVSRAIGGLGCGGYDLRLTYYKPKVEFGVGITGLDEVVDSKTVKINGCKNYGSSEGIPNFPKKGFVQLVETTGVVNDPYFRGFVKVQITNSNGNNRQASFHINTSNTAKFGFADPNQTKSTNWINTYPTNAADDHRVAYTFRPNCSMKPGDVLDLNWDDVNYPSQFQPSDQKPYARLIRHKHDGSDRQVALPINFVGSGPENREYKLTSADFYDNGKRPYAFSLEFYNIRGGNGISFNQPYDSADSRIECPPPQPEPGSGSAITGCQTATVKDAKSYDPPGGLTQPYSTNTYVHITDSQGNILVDKNLPSAQPNSGHLGSGDEKTWNYKPKGSKVTVSIDRRYHNTSTNPDKWVSYQTTVDTYDCYTAEIGSAGSCGIVVYGTIGSTEVSENDGFVAKATVYNTGKLDLPENIDGGKLMVEGTGGKHYVNNWIPKSGSRSVWMNLVAPDGPSTNTVTLTPKYDGKFDIGPACSVQHSVYEPFKFSAPAVTRAFVPDTESPSKINFTTTVHKESGPDVNNTVRRSFTGKGSPINPTNSNLPTTHTATYGGDQLYQDSYDIPPGYQLGDEYCINSKIDRTEGYRGPGGVDDVILTVGESSASTCDKVTNRPYVRAYGADVAAGCGTNKGIFAFMRPISEQSPSPAANKSGSGSQLAALALDQISGFTSASLRTDAPSAPRGLTFANSNPASPDLNSEDPILGGGMTSNGWCAPDYFNETQFSNPSQKASSTASSFSITSAIGSGQDYKQTYIKPTGGKLLLDGVSGYSYHHTIYVEGDVFVRGNIIYAADYSGGINTIPSFALIVKGNIYIDNDVAQMDGFFVAQPDSSRPGTGRLYTCATENAPPTPINSPVTNPSSLFTHCGAADGPKRQLTINGAVVADRLILNRTGYSLRDSVYKEQAGNSKAAEIFNFSPEMYLSPPVFNPRATFTSGDYQYLATLPPIL